MPLEGPGCSRGSWRATVPSAGEVKLKCTTMEQHLSHENGDDFNIVQDEFDFNKVLHHQGRFSSSRATITVSAGMNLNVR